MARIVRLETFDLRFPTSDGLDGSDAMNPEPDYSAATVVIHTDVPGLEGCGLAFTIGRGNEVCVAGIEAYAPLVVGRRLDEIEADPGRFWRELAGDSQLRWLGPDKGAVHLALAAVTNGVWDLLAKRAGQPLWRYLAELPAETLVGAVDFRHLRDAMGEQQALDLLAAASAGREARERELRSHGHPAYITSAGWLGYDDGKIRERCREALGRGFDAFKMKVGRDLEDDLRRARILRQEIGPHRMLMLDANQVWGVEEAIAAMERLAECDPLWIEEPTHPDDVLGHARIARAVAPVRVATGEHCANAVMVKQLLQAEATGFLQIDGCRLGGVNEVIAALLLAARFDVPVCPHAGGVGLCQQVQHWSVFDRLRVSPDGRDRRIEYADHLHEHFQTPLVVRGGAYRLPETPGIGLDFRPESRARYRYPDGEVWKARRGEE